MLKVPVCLLDKLFLLVVSFRNAYYDRFGPQYRSKTPIVSVGNLSTGGTGKTPMCLWLAKQFIRLDYKIAIVMRGYHQGSGESDEAQIYRSALGVEHVYVGADRIQNVRVIDKSAYDLVILDDGFQHRQLGRLFDIVLVNATQAPMQDYSLPRGNLREGVGSLKRADVLVWTRSEMVSSNQIDILERQMGKAFPLLPQMRVSTKMNALEDESGLEVPIQSASFFVICGIGHPENFFEMLKAANAKVLDQRVFKDHHEYREEEIQAMIGEAKQLEASHILMTEKDYVKWKGRCDFPIAIAKIQPTFEEAKDERLVKMILDKINHE